MGQEKSKQPLAGESIVTSSKMANDAQNRWANDPATGSRTLENVIEDICKLEEKRYAKIELRHSMVYWIAAHAAGAFFDAVRVDLNRYHWLRCHFRFANDSMREIWFDRDNYHSALKDQSAEELDKAIDQAMSPLAPESPAKEHPGEQKAAPTQEQCAYCGHFYPKPVSYHHSEEECAVNKRSSSPEELYADGYEKEAFAKAAAAIRALQHASAWQECAECGMPEKCARMKACQLQPPVKEQLVERNVSYFRLLALKMIAEWDCLNPPRSDLLSDLSWLKRLVDRALAGHDPRVETAPQVSAKANSGGHAEADNGNRPVIPEQQALSDERDLLTPAVAAPDAAALVKRLNDAHANTGKILYREAAALIEKLNQTLVMKNELIDLSNESARQPPPERP